MPRIEYSPSDPRPIERLLCPRCGTQLILSRVEPDEPGFDLRTFQCPKCQHSESFVVKEVQLAASFPVLPELGH
jgi:DNA-directed RNA polymerase subunit M/transcription elongation factor TFIIS